MAKSDEKKENLAQTRAKRKGLTRGVTTLVVVAAVGVLGYKLWQNPLLLQQAREMLLRSKQVEDVYQPQIDKMQQQLDILEKKLMLVKAKAENPDFAEMENRIEMIEQFNANTIKSKADVQTVLGVIGRLDTAEGRLNDLAKVTDDGALILTAAMLVKDAAQRGGEFVYEAEVLSELAAGNHKIAKEVMRLSEIAPLGIPTTVQLQEQFAEAYRNKYPEAPTEEIQVADNWKDRIYYQLNKVVKIKKVDEVKSEENQAAFSEEDRAWAVIRDFVLQGEIAKAAAIAKKPLNKDILADKEFAAWLEQAEIYNDFYAAVSKISANALAVMKAKFLRGY